MRTLGRVILFAGAALLAGVAGFELSGKTSARQTADNEMLRITAANPCASVELTGKLHGKEYDLVEDRDLNKVPLYVACIDPIGTGDVGKAFQATLDVGKFTGETGVMMVSVPGRGTVFYDIEAAREP